MNEKNKPGAMDGDQLVERGTAKTPTNEHDSELAPPVDESDSGPEPAIGENRNTNRERHPTIDAEDAKDA